jgi:hypothetical protein
VAIKVTIVHYPPEADRTGFLESLIGRLPHCGCVLTDTCPDVLLVHDEALKADPRVLERGVPVVVLERSDSAGILDERLRSLLEDDRVVACFKNHVLYPLERHNDPVAADHRFHGRLLNDVYHQESDEHRVPMSGSALAKIVCVQWDLLNSFAHPAFREFRNLGSRPRRPFDVHAVFSDNCYNALINRHRTHFKQSVQNLAGLRTMSGARLPLNQYHAFLRQSKVVVSPWGWGEWCLRDAEALLAGCTLVKPETGFVRTRPDLFRNGWYAPCRIDGSDLPEVVRAAVEGFDADAERREAIRAHLVQAFDYPGLVRAFCESVAESLPVQPVRS